MGIIILRKYNKIRKLFSIVTPFSQSLSGVFRIPEDKLKQSKINVQKTDEYKKQYKNLSPGNKEKVDQFDKDLREGHIFDDARAGDRTHYLGEESRPSKGFVTFSKWINDEDRFNYLVYKPETEDGEHYTQKIVLSSCFEHTKSGQPGAYVRGQRGNVWHPKKNSKRKRGKKRRRG